MMEEIENRFQDIIQSMVEKKLDDIILSPKKIEELLNSKTINRIVWESLQSKVINEIGNRLRAPLYNGGEVDKIFESVWKPQLDEAMKDRVRKKVLNECEKIVKEVFETVLKTIELQSFKR